MTMTMMKKKQSRLRLILMAAAALGTSSAVMSGALATFATQHAIDGGGRVA